MLLLNFDHKVGRIGHLINVKFIRALPIRIKDFNEKSHIKVDSSPFYSDSPKYEHLDCPVSYSCRQGLLLMIFVPVYSCSHAKL